MSHCDLSEQQTLMSTAVSESRGGAHRAWVTKVEALLVQAAKCKVRKTQKEFVVAQYAELAGQGIDETLVQPQLIQWSKTMLD